MDRYAFLENAPSPLARDEILPLDGPYLVYQGKKMLNFCSQDYLSLSQHSDLKKNATRFLLHYGVGTATCSLTGSLLESQRLIEERLALLLGKDAAHLFHALFPLHLYTLTALSPSVIFTDNSVNSELMQAVRLTQAEVQKYNHNNLTHLQRQLEACDSKGPKIIVTQSLFEYEGDTADLQRLSELAADYEVLLYVDDSQALGVYGKEGMGCAAHSAGVDFIVGSFGLSGGSSGAYLGCSHQMKNYLLTKNAELKNSSLAPAAIGAIDAAMEMIPQMEGERGQLEQRAYWLRKKFHEMGLSIGNTTSHLIPLYLENQESVDNLFNTLVDVGILARKLPESIGIGLHFAVNLAHTPEQVNQLASALPIFDDSSQSGEAISDRHSMKIVPKKPETGKVFEHSTLQ